MIAGKQGDVVALGLTAEKSLEAFEAEMREAYETLNAECDLVVTLCDIYGGTPFNVTTRACSTGWRWSRTPACRCPWSSSSC